MAFSDATLFEAQARLSRLDPTGRMVLESRLILAWRLGDPGWQTDNTVWGIADTHQFDDDVRQDQLKDLISRIRDPNVQPTDAEVFEAYITSCCDEDVKHPDDDWDDFVPECDCP